MRAWASEPAHPSMAGATILSVAPVVWLCHCPACFLKVYQGFRGQWQWLVQVLAIVANRRFHAS